LRFKYAGTAALGAFAGLRQFPGVERKSTRSATRGKDINEVASRLSRPEDVSKLILGVAALKP
jgi:hypothetical protein